MSLTASGTLSGDGNGNFSARVVLTNHLVKDLNGKVSSAIPQFAGIIKVAYESDDDLSGTYDLDKNATVGPNTVNWPFKNDTGKTVVFTGGLNPFLDKAYSATGSGTWQSS